MKGEGMGKARLSLATTVAALVAAFALAACGDDNDGGSADEDQITAAIERAATSGDPAACTDAQTQKFVEQTSGGASAAAAVKQCEADAADTPADDVEVSDIEVDGDTATANAAVTGSTFDGQTLDLALVKEGDRWKVDEFKGFAEFDREAMINAFRTELANEPGVTPAGVDCVVKQFQAAPDEEIEGSFTGSDPQAEERLFGPCGKYFQG